MKKNLITIGLLSGVLFLVSCKGYHYIDTTGGVAKKYNRIADQSEILVWNDKADIKPSEKIGIITVRKNNLPKAIKKAKKAAANNNGNAILITTAEDQTGGQKVGAFFIGGNAFKGKYTFNLYRTN